MKQRFGPYLAQIWLIVWCSAIVCAHVQAQDTLRTGRDVIRIDHGNGKKVLQIQPGVNYLDPTTRRYQARHARIDTGSGGYEYEHATDFRFRIAPQAAKWGVWVGGDYVIWHPLKPVRPLRYRKDGGTLTYFALWDSVDAHVTVTPEGLKEDFIFKGGSADSLVFDAEFSAVPNVSDAQMAVGRFLIPRPTATDANGATVPVTWGMRGPSGGKYRLTVRIDPTGKTYPITLDPTVNFVAGTGGARSNDARIIQNDSNNNSSGTILVIGSNNNAERALLMAHFEDSITVGASVDSIILQLNLSSKAGSLWQDSLALFSLRDSARYNGADYPTWFHKRRPGIFWNTAGLGGGSDFNNTALDTSYMADTTAAGAWRWKGTSTVGRSFWQWARAVVTGDSINYGWFIKTRWPERAGAHYRVFHAAGAVSAANRWTVTVYYVSVPKLTAMSALNDSSIRFVIDTTGAGASKDTAEVLQLLDSARVYSWPLSRGLTDTGRAFRGDSIYRVLARTKSTAGALVWGLIADSIKDTTLAKAPVADTVAGYSPNTIYITVPATSNTPKTHVVVWDSTAQRFIDRLGNQIAAATDTPWARRDQYFPLKANKSRIPSTKYRFMIRARAQDSVISALGPIDSAVTNSLVKSVTIARIDTKSFSVQTVAESIDSKFSHASYYAIDGDGNGTADTILTDTFTVTTGTTLKDTTKATNASLVPNQKVIGRRFRRENPDSLVSSGLDTFFTNPKAPTLDTSAFGHVIRFLSDTSAILKFRTNNRMPFLFALQDSYSVAKDCVRTWWKPDSFSLAADTAWLDTTRNGFSGTALDTVILLRKYRPWPPLSKTNVRMYYKAGDSAYNDLRAN